MCRREKGCVWSGKPVLHTTVMGRYPQCMRTLHAWHQVIRPAGTFSTVIVIVVLCCLHVHVRFGIKSHAPPAPVSKIGLLLPVRSSVGKFIRGPLLVASRFPRCVCLWTSLYRFLVPHEAGAQPTRHS